MRKRHSRRAQDHRFGHCGRIPHRLPLWNRDAVFGDGLGGDPHDAYGCADLPDLVNKHPFTTRRTCADTIHSLQATKSAAGGTVLFIMMLVFAYFALIASMQSASRLTWSFARDDAIIFSRFFSQIHPTLNVPVWALLFNSLVMFLLGCIYLGSTTAFNALIGVAVVLQQLGFAIPAALLMYRRRTPEYLPRRVGSFFTHFNLGAFGWVCNAVTVAWAIIILIFFDFPNAIPVTGLTMNYIPAVLGGMAVFGIINWFSHARKYYYGPVIDVEHFKEQTEGM